MKAPTVAPVKITDYTARQSNYEIVGKLPSRSIMLGPSGSGKTTLLQNIILDVYKGCFGRIYICSHSIVADSAWLPVTNAIENAAKVQNTDE